MNRPNWANWPAHPAHPAEVEVVEFNERAGRKVIVEQFGVEDDFEDTEPAWEVTQTEADSWLGVLSERSALRAEKSL